MYDQIHSSLKDAMWSVGIAPPESFALDGGLHRFHVTGDKLGEKNGWYVVYPDVIAVGRFGCWKRGIKKHWSIKPTNAMSVEEKVSYRAKMEVTKRVREQEKAQIYEEARARANKIWRSAVPASIEHPYLKAKRVKPYGVRTSQNDLVVPVRNSNMELVGLQFIRADGQKRFLSGTAKKGAYFSIGKPRGLMLICEGFATGATLHEATGYAVAVAFDVGNLKSVAQTMLKKFPGFRIVFCADDDFNKKGNPGLTKATEAALAIGGVVVVPKFPERRRGNG